jgi:outer membrane protein assembly factor BamB
LKEWLEVIDPRSGAVLWRTNETGRPIGVAAAGEVTIVTIDGKARAYDTASGRQLWESDPPQEHFSEAYPVIADGVVYIAIEGATHAFW